MKLAISNRGFLEGEMIVINQLIVRGSLNPRYSPEMDRSNHVVLAIYHSRALVQTAVPRLLFPKDPDGFQRGFDFRGAGSWARSPYFPTA